MESLIIIDLQWLYVNKGSFVFMITIIPQVNGKKEITRNT